jgi:glycosyltransferase involved in cell wall biosynthesis
MLQSLSLKNKYKLLQVHNMPDYLVFVGLFHKVAGIPIVLDLHDLMVELFESKWNRWQAQILGPVVRIAEKLSCRFANQLITTSDGFRQRLIERGVPPEKIILVMNSADNNIFKKSKREFPKLQHGVKLLYHGTVASRYGLHIAIEAVWELQKKIPETTLYIFGKYDPSYRAYLEKKIECLGLRDRVHLGGYLSLEEIREVIVHSDIGIVPYLSDSFMNLALSTKTFEYVAMGVPVIASRLPSLTAIFSENCIMYFEPGDANDFVNRLLALCADPEMRRLYVERASLAYESIAWPVMEKRYLNLIQGLMRKRDAG